MEHRAVDVEARAVARAVEALGVLVERHRTAQVRAVHRVDVELALVLDDEPAKGEVALGVVAAPVGHDERRVWRGRGADLDRLPFLDLVDRGLQRDVQRSLALALRRRRPEVDEDRQQARHHRRCHEHGDRPTEKGPARERPRCQGVSHSAQMLTTADASAVGRQPDRAAHLGHRLASLLAGAVAALVKDRRDPLGAQLGPCLAEWTECLDDALGKQLLLVVAADLGLTAQVPVVLPVVEEELVEGAHVARAGMPRLRPVCALDVGDHAQHLLADHFRVIGHAHRVADGLRHPLLSVGALDERRLGQQRSRLGEHGCVGPVELPDDLADELEVRQLIFADRHAATLDHHDVRPLQHGIGQKAEVHVVRVLLGHLLEGRRAQDPPERRDHGQQQRELRHLGDLRLLVQDAALRADAHRDQIRCEIEDLALHGVPVGLGCQRVVVGDEVEALVVLLQLDPVLGRAKVVAEVEPARWPHAAQDPHPIRHRRWSVTSPLRLAKLPDHELTAERPASSAGLGSRALRNTVLVLTAKVIALVTVLYIVRRLGHVEYGSFTVLVNLTAIVSVVLDLGFNVLFVREGARHHDEIQRYMRNVMSLRLLMSVVSFGLLAALVYPLGLGGLLVPGFLLMVFTSYSTLLRNGLYAVQQLGYEAIAVVLESAVLLALVLIGGRTHRDTVFYVWAYAIQYAFSCAYFLIVLAAKRIAVPGWRFEAALLRQWFWKGLPFALTFVLTILYFRIDQPLIGIFRGFGEAGWYGAAYKPIESLLFVPITFLSVVFPVLSVYHRERPKEMLDAVSRFYKALLLMGWPASVGIFVLAHPLTPLLLGRDYAPSEPALRVLALALGK